MNVAIAPSEENKIRMILGEKVFGAVQKARVKWQKLEGAAKAETSATGTIDQVVLLLRDVAQQIGVPEKPAGSETNQAKILAYQLIWNEASGLISGEIPRWEFN